MPRIQVSQSGEHAVRVDDVLKADNHAVRRTGGDDVAGDAPDLLLGGLEGVLLAVDVVEDDHVGSVAFEQQAANTGVQTRRVDDHTARRADTIAFPAFAVAEFVYLALGEQWVIALHFRGFQDGSDVLHGVVGLILGLFDVEDVPEPPCRQGNDRTLGVRGFRESAWPDVELGGAAVRMMPPDAFPELGVEVCQGPGVGAREQGLKPFEGLNRDGQAAAEVS